MLSEFTAVPASILGIEMSACSSGASIWGPAFSKLKIDAHILHQCKFGVRITKSKRPSACIANNGLGADDKGPLIL
jgi:hypothetical protein